MLKDEIYTDVANATVILPKKLGQGVLVNNNLILTAAHCIDFDTEGAMALGDHFVEEIEIGNRKFRVTPIAVDLVTDIAVLESFGTSNELNEFDNFCEETKPVPLCSSDFELFKEFRVHIYTHKKTWVTANAKQCREDAPNLFIEADEPIEGGTSGGPVINDLGELVGIVSQTLEDMKGRHKPVGPIPRPHLTLPVWVCRRIFGRDFS